MNLEELDPEVRALVERVSARLLEQGAKATLLTGSHARGEAGPNSDVDLFAVGDGPRQRVEVLDGRTVSVHWFTPEEARQRLSSPLKGYLAAHGWGDAILVDDPVGVGAELQDEARAWSWDRIAAEADAVAADELVARAEYVRKLVDALEAGFELDAAALTADTALHLGHLAAIRRRVTSESENGLWEAIADAAPPDWAQALRQALRVDGEDVADAAKAAIRLFEAIAADVAPLLEEQQQAIVDHALAAIQRAR